MHFHAYPMPTDPEVETPIPMEPTVWLRVMNSEEMPDGARVIGWQLKTDREIDECIDSMERELRQARKILKERLQRLRLQAQMKSMSAQLAARNAQPANT